MAESEKETNKEVRALSSRALSGAATYLSIAANPANAGTAGPSELLVCILFNTNELLLNYIFASIV